MTQHSGQDHEIVVILPPTFSLFRLLHESFKELKKHISLWVRVGVVPFVLLFLAYGFFYYGHTKFFSFSSFLPAHLASLQEEISVLTLLDQIGRPFLMSLVGLLAWSLITVRGTRFLLHNQQLRRVPFSFGVVHQKVFFAAFVFFMATGGVLASNGFVWWGLSGQWDSSGAFIHKAWWIWVISAPLIQAGWSFLGFYVLGRLALYAQAIALERPKPFWTSWQITKGHVLPIIGGYGIIWGLSVISGILLVGLLQLSGLWALFAVWGQQLILMCVGAVTHLLKIIYLTVYFAKVFKILEPLQKFPEPSSRAPH